MNCTALKETDRRKERAYPLVDWHGFTGPESISDSREEQNEGNSASSSEHSNKAWLPWRHDDDWTTGQSRSSFFQLLLPLAPLNSWAHGPPTGRIDMLYHRMVTNMTKCWEENPCKAAGKDLSHSFRCRGWSSYSRGSTEAGAAVFCSFHNHNFQQCNYFTSCTVGASPGSAEGKSSW